MIVASRKRASCEETVRVVAARGRRGVALEVDLAHDDQVSGWPIGRWRDPAASTSW